MHVPQSSKPSKIHSTGGVLVDPFNKTDFTASKTDLLSMLGDMLTKSKLTKTAFAGKNILLILSIISSRWLLFLILDCILSDNSNNKTHSI